MKIAAATTFAALALAVTAGTAGADTGGRFIGVHDGGPVEGAPVTIHLDTVSSVRVDTWDAYPGRETSAFDAGQQDEETIVLHLDGVQVGATADLVDGVASASASHTFEVGPGELTLSHGSTGGPDSVHWSAAVTPLVETTPAPEPEPEPEIPAVTVPMPEMVPAPTIVEPVEETIVSTSVPEGPATTVPAAAPAIETAPAPSETMTTLPYTGTAETVALGVFGLVLAVGGYGLVQASKAG